MDTKVAYRYITRKENSGEPIIKGTRTSVRIIVENWRLGNCARTSASDFGASL